MDSFSHLHSSKTISLNLLKTIRSSCPVMFFKKSVHKNLAQFTGKHLYCRLFFDKGFHIRPATLLKKKLRRRCFPVNFSKFLKISFFIEHLWWLLLNQSVLGKIVNQIIFRNFPFSFVKNIYLLSYLVIYLNISLLFITYFYTLWKHQKTGGFWSS